ncbi:hypothetical protein [Nocardioides sp. URHA0020]|nr:hypothetical protein [Nocardioides sp. URHA0020]
MHPARDRAPRAVVGGVAAYVAWFVARLVHGAVIVGRRPPQR